MIKKPQNSPEKKLVINDRLLSIFAKDAAGTIDTVSSIMISGTFSEENLRKYTIAVHGIKTALAYIGQNELSAEALGLESAGRISDTDTIVKRTPDFLKELQFLVDTVRARTQSAADDVTEDKEFLKQQLTMIKKAAEEFDEVVISRAISALQEKKWSGRTEQRIGELSDSLLHSDFDNIAELASD